MSIRPLALPQLPTAPRLAPPQPATGAGVQAIGPVVGLADRFVGEDDFLGESSRPERYGGAHGSQGPAGGGGVGELLRRGARGVGVRALQEQLKAAGFNPGSVDGDYGARTEAAVRAFQRARGLKVDGVAGHRTWAALGVKAQAPAARVSGAVSTPDGPMVRRGGEMIAARLAEKYDAMVAAAARDGVTLRLKSGYRPYAEQVVLWNRFGRNPRRVARPGHSNHQTGTAMDFANTRGAWAWLKRNASRFGFHNYPAEPWHYSLNGR